MYPESLQLVVSRQFFEFNLLKSLSVLWMMSVLVIALGVMCSTFLSWPIAIVLTILLLLGHWGIGQVSENTGPGLGRLLVNDFKFTDPAISAVFSKSVDTLSGSLNGLAAILPDTSRFDAIEDISQGTSIAGARLLDAGTVLAIFALPAAVLAYVLLKMKEVAP